MPDVTFAQACCQNNQCRIRLSLWVQGWPFALGGRRRHLMTRLGQYTEQSWQITLRRLLSQLAVGTEAARPLLKLIGVHTSFEWVCIWTRSSFSPFLLFPEENEQFCLASVLFNSKIVQLPSPHQPPFIKERSAYLSLQVKGCYIQLHFSNRFFFSYFFFFLYLARMLCEWLLTVNITYINLSFTYRTRAKLNWGKRPSISFGVV